jgi:ParB-like chromosome segregation protein Spo0J
MTGIESSKKRRASLMDSRRGEGIWVHLDEVTEGPGPCTMSYGFNLGVLVESIRKVGLLNPPLVAGNEKGGFDIVAGYRRILALKVLGQPRAFCENVTSVLSSPLERFLANFYENLATRRFNDIEKAMILERLRGYVQKEEILASFMPLLSLPSHEGTLEFYLKLASLEDGVQKAIAQEEISIKVAKALVELERGSRQDLFHWIDILKLNFNQQIKFIEYVQDISMREDMTIHEILSEESFLKILENPRLNNPQKAKGVLETLRVRRYPRLARAQQVVERIISAVPLPHDAAVRYDPYFEDASYHLEIRFKDGKELRKTIALLHSLDELETIPDPWLGE